MDKKNDQPPTPPPLPPASRGTEKTSLALKLKTAPPGWAFEYNVDHVALGCLTPPAGKYLFYGTLQDPSMLCETLGLPDLPVLQPAYVIGYKTRLWGQYPAAVKEPFSVLRGMMFDIPDERSARKLADYETKNYQPMPCIIRHGHPGADSEEDLFHGFIFEYCGSEIDLSDGTFDLDIWLTRMGRKGHRSQSNAKQESQT